MRILPPPARGPIPLFLVSLFLIFAIVARVSADETTGVHKPATKPGPDPTGDNTKPDVQTTAAVPTVTDTPATDTKDQPITTDQPKPATTAPAPTTQPATTAEPKPAPTTTDTPDTTAQPTTEPTPESTTQSTEMDTTTTTDSPTTTDMTTSSITSSTTSISSSTTDSSTTSSSSTSSTNTLIPVVTVPPTADAPYMQKSSTPEGTVFIAVGAVLGVIGLSVLAWRALVAWSVNRSVRRSAAVMQASESKSLLRPKRRRRRSSRSHGHSHSHSHHDQHRSHHSGFALDKHPSGKRSSHRSSSYTAASKVPSSNSGLFFSPTAGAGSGLHATPPAGAGSGNRGSTYLPAGYYAAASAATPGGGGGGGGGGGQGYLSSTFSGLGPQSQGYTRTRSGPSPPASPGLSSASVHETAFNSRQSLAGASTSSLNLASPSHVRAPSAYLEDLFESHAPSEDWSRRS